MPSFNKPIKTCTFSNYIRKLICVIFALLILLAGCSKTGSNEVAEDADYTNIVTFADSNEGNEVGFTESFVSLAIVLYSAFYYGFTGKDVTSGIHFTYVNKNGDILEEYSTDEMETKPVEEIAEEAD